MRFSIIAAVAMHDGAIGVTRDGVPGLPWPTLRHDMAFFAWITRAKYPVQMATHFTMFPQTIDIAHSSHSDAFHVVDNNSVIMGRRTWETLPRRSLPGRALYVLTSHPYAAMQEMPPGSDISAADTLESALNDARKERVPHIFIAGGASLYAEALRHPACERLYLTEVDAAYPEADTHFPQSDNLCWETGSYAHPIVHEGYGDHAVMSLRHWQRIACSAWITEPERPRYRFTIYERA